MPAAAGCDAPGVLVARVFTVPIPPNVGAVGAVVTAGPGVEPKRPPPPKAGVEFAAPKPGVEVPPSPGVAPNVGVGAGAGELN